MNLDVTQVTHQYFDRSTRKSVSAETSAHSIIVYKP
jgi:hypothetical protein